MNLVCCIGQKMLLTEQLACTFPGSICQSLHCFVNHIPIGDLFLAIVFAAWIKMEFLSCLGFFWFFLSYLLSVYVCVCIYMICICPLNFPLEVTSPLNKEAFLPLPSAKKDDD